jgi:hypothetical protein
MILRVEKGSPLSTNEMDNNLLELENRVTLTTDQIVNGIKTFTSIECDDVPLNDNSNKLINTKNVNDKIDDVIVSSLNYNMDQEITGDFVFSSMKVPDVSDISNKIINTKTCSDITSLLGNVTVSTTTPVNPDLSPSRKIWIKVSSNVPRSILDIYYWDGSWDIPATGSSFADAILITPNVFYTLDHIANTSPTLWLKAICPPGCSWCYFWFEGAMGTSGNVFDSNGNGVNPNLIPGDMYYVEAYTSNVSTNRITINFF